MLIIQCDMCGAEATRAPNWNQVNTQTWPEDGGCSINILFNNQQSMRRDMLVCPACTRKHNLPAGAGVTRSVSKDEKEETMSKLAELLFRENEEAIADIASDVYDSRGEY